MTNKRKSIIKEAIERLDGLMAIGISRAAAKAEIRTKGISPFAFSTGKIHSYQARQTYQSITLRFLQWCRTTHGFTRLSDVDRQADLLVSHFLTERIGQGKSAWTLQTERSALRLFFQDRFLAAHVTLPARRQQDIRRSRLPALRDQYLRPENWQALIQFAHACGLRRAELRDLVVGDVFTHPVTRRLQVQVRRGKGGKSRSAPVLRGQEEAICAVVKGRTAEEHVFIRLPRVLDIHAIRRQYAQRLYVERAGKPIPEGEGPLRLAELDAEAVRQVSLALGHYRLDVVLRHYLR